MTTATKTNAVHHGIEIVPTYRSPVTGRPCQTIQGYEHVWFGGTSWAFSIRDAKATIDGLREKLDRRNIGHIMDDILEWVKTRWPEYEEAIEVELARRALQRGRDTEYEITGDQARIFRLTVKIARIVRTA